MLQGILKAAAKGFVSIFGVAQKLRKPRQQSTNELTSSRRRNCSITASGELQIQMRYRSSKPIANADTPIKTLNDIGTNAYFNTALESLTSEFEAESVCVGGLYGFVITAV